MIIELITTIAILAFLFLFIKLMQLSSKKRRKKRTKAKNTWEHRLKKGHDFEDYTIRLLKTSGFKILELSKDSKPDLKVESPNGEIFRIECKWRKNFTPRGNNIGFQWTDRERKAGIYQGVELATKEKVFIVAGLGGKASQPKRMFTFPVKDGFDGFIFNWKIEKYERNPEATFSYNNYRLT